MTVIEAIILGVFQGFTELLPVSSSGHLRMGRELFGLLEKLSESEKLAFDVLMHAGTLIVIIIAFRKQVFSMLKGRRHLWIMVIYASIPAAVFGVGFKLLFPGYEYPLWAIGIFYPFCGAFLMIAEPRTKDNFDMNEIKPKHAWLIGLYQAVAILPGVSRSGMTILSGGMLGLKREEAMAFSFLMSIVAIGGATIIELKDIANLGQLNPVPLAAGFIASVLSGMFAIWMLKIIVRKRKMAWFGPYCIAIGILAWVLYLK